LRTISVSDPDVGSNLTLHQKAMFHDNFGPHPIPDFSSMKKFSKILRVTLSLYKFRIVIQNLIQNLIIYLSLSSAYVFLSNNPAIFLGLELKNSAAMRLMMYLALPRR
jgi:hypothetical protein